MQHVGEISDSTVEVTDRLCSELKFFVCFPHQNMLKCKASFTIILFTVCHLVSIPLCISRVYILQSILGQAITLRD